MRPKVGTCHEATKLPRDGREQGQQCPIVVGSIWVVTGGAHKGLFIKVLRTTLVGKQLRVKIRPIGHGNKGWSKSQVDDRWIVWEKQFRCRYRPAHRAA